METVHSIAFEDKEVSSFEGKGTSSGNSDGGSAAVVIDEVPSLVWLFVGWGQRVKCFVHFGGSMNTESIIADLEQERDRLTAAIQALSGARTRRSGRRGRLSAAARKRISDGMRRNWAARKKREKAA